jgi:hypothetical protein
MLAFIARKEWVMLAFIARKEWVMLAFDAFKWVMDAFDAFKFCSITALLLTYDEELMYPVRLADVMANEACAATFRAPLTCRSRVVISALTYKWVMDAFDAFK